MPATRWLASSRLAWPSSVGQLTLDSSTALSTLPAFQGVFFAFLYTSPSFILGLVFFLPLIILVGERLNAGEGASPSGDWILVALFVFAASDTKVAILPVIMAALGLYGIWAWLVHRRIPSAVWISGALAVTAMAVIYFLQYQGLSSTLGVKISAGFFDSMLAVSLVNGDLAQTLPDFPGRGTLLSGFGVLFGGLGLFAAQLVGLVWIVRRQGYRLRGEQAWLAALLAGGLLSTVTLSSSQVYFLFYGVMAGCLLSAEGLTLAWRSRPSLSGSVSRLIGLGLAWLVLLGALMAAPDALDLFSGPRSSAYSYMLWYGGFAISVGLLYLAARRWIGPTRWPAAALVCFALLVAGVLDVPSSKLEPALSNPTPSVESGRRLTPELHRALVWIRRETPDDAVIAVNDGEALEFNYAAFAERRTFLGGGATPSSPAS